jgi:hypothetical protein
MTDALQIKKKPYPVFQDGGVLTDESLLLGIPVKSWDQAFTGTFEKNLERGNEIMSQLKARREQSC